MGSAEFARTGHGLEIKELGSDFFVVFAFAWKLVAGGLSQVIEQLRFAVVHEVLAFLILLENLVDFLLKNLLRELALDLGSQKAVPLPRLSLLLLLTDGLLFAFPILNLLLKCLQLLVFLGFWLNDDHIILLRVYLIYHVVQYHGLPVVGEKGRAG